MTTIDSDAFIRVNELDIIIFASQADVECLFSSNHWFADGTFHVTLDGFDQMYTLHAFINGQTFLCVYALLPGRSEAVYQRFLQHVNSFGPQTAPISIVTNFEMTAINALKLTY